MSPLWGFWSAVVSSESAPKLPGVLSSATKVLQNFWECCRQQRKRSKTSGSAVVSSESAPKSLGALSSAAKPVAADLVNPQPMGKRNFSSVMRNRCRHLAVGTLESDVNILIPKRRRMRTSSATKYLPQLKLKIVITDNQQQIAPKGRHYIAQGGNPGDSTANNQQK